MPEVLSAWERLARLAQSHRDRRIAELLQSGRRQQPLRFRIGELLLDCSRQRLDDEVLNALIALAEARGFAAARAGLYQGELVNRTERRAALHTALRAPSHRRPPIVAAEIGAGSARLAALAGAIHSGTQRGYTGKPFTDLVHIGIGGSHLGPELVVQALRGAVPARLRAHFVANVDGQALTTTLDGLNPETTAFVIVSKTFSTLETRLNANSARSWFLERTASPDALAAHFFAVSANVEAAGAFGIPEENLLPMWDWVGGRYSLWSAVGLPIAAVYGVAAFQALLDGAHTMDCHFESAPLRENAPLVLALAGIWNYNFFGVQSHAVLPYDERLALLPDYLQQLEMESNGKRVQVDGSPVAQHTMAVLWGNVGTNGQHAFHQLLHQGTRAFSADFLLSRQGGSQLTRHHEWLLANALAQAEAMTHGRQTDDPHRAVPGDHPVTTILLDDVTPTSLGQLLALYEHKVFCQGLIWNINSFDQFGVELGKALAGPIHEALTLGGELLPDPATSSLLAALRESR